jgi:Bifunctional DNA primase/polymerase, N-terminal
MKATTDTIPFRAALDYAAHSWPIVPLWWPVDGRCACPAGADCGSPGKHPLTEHGVNDASSERDVILRWFRRWPHANIGIATGALSKIVVLDVDPRNGGNESLAQFIGQYGPLPPGPTVRTGGGGRHFYYDYTDLSFPKVAGPGLDVLSNGRIACAPYSEHVNGQRYRWEVPPW